MLRRDLPNALHRRRLRVWPYVDYLTPSAFGQAEIPLIGAVDPSRFSAVNLALAMEPR
jgi:hypothetical protein